jgi:hypothetical protein
LRGLDLVVHCRRPAVAVYWAGTRPLCSSQICLASSSTQSRQRTPATEPSFFLRLGSHDHQFLSGDWAYHDSYLGESDFIGQEVVYHQARVVWGMNYFGYILEPTLITSAEAGRLIKSSLTKLYVEGRFLGPFHHSEGDLEYIDTNEGDVSFFTGREWIEQRGVKVYELLYHGGTIK